MPSLILRPALTVMVGVRSSIKSAEVCRNSVVNTAVESAVEVLYADDTSGVYKISMVRMSTTD